MHSLGTLPSAFLATVRVVLTLPHIKMLPRCGTCIYRHLRRGLLEVQLPAQVQPG